MSMMVATHCILSLPQEPIYENSDEMEDSELQLKLDQAEARAAKVCVCARARVFACTMCACMTVNKCVRSYDLCTLQVLQVFSVVQGAIAMSLTA